MGWPSGHVRVQVGTRRQPHKGAAWMVGSESKCGEEGECQNGKSGTTKERNPPVRKRVLVEPGGWLHKGGPFKKYVSVLGSWKSGSQLSEKRVTTQKKRKLQRPLFIGLELEVLDTVVNGKFSIYRCIYDRLLDLLIDR